MLPENFLTGLQGVVCGSRPFRSLSEVEKVELSGVAEEVLQMKGEGVLPPLVGSWHVPDEEYLAQLGSRVYGGIQSDNKGEVHRAWLRRVATWTLKLGLVPIASVLAEAAARDGTTVQDWGMG